MIHTRVFDRAENKTWGRTTNNEYGKRLEVPCLSKQQLWSSRAPRKSGVTTGVPGRRVKVGISYTIFEEIFEKASPFGTALTTLRSVAEQTQGQFLRPTFPLRSVWRRENVEGPTSKGEGRTLGPQVLVSPRAVSERMLC